MSSILNVAIIYANFICILQINSNVATNPLVRIVPTNVNLSFILIKSNDFVNGTYKYNISQNHCLEMDGLGEINANI